MVSIILAIVGTVNSGSKPTSSTEDIIQDGTTIYNVSTSFQHYCVPESYAKDEASKNHNPYIEFIEGKIQFKAEGGIIEEKPPNASHVISCPLSFNACQGDYRL